MFALIATNCSFLCRSGDFFYQKSTTGTTKAAVEANNGTYCLRKQIEKFPLIRFVWDPLIIRERSSVQPSEYVLHVGITETYPRCFFSEATIKVVLTWYFNLRLMDSYVCLEYTANQHVGVLFPSQRVKGNFNSGSKVKQTVQLSVPGIQN